MRQNTTAMNIAIIVLLLTISFFYCQPGCCADSTNVDNETSAGNTGDNKSAPLMMPCYTFDLSEQEIHELEIKGNNGDGEAAYKLWNYYSEYGGDDEDDDAYYWLRKAAENGDIGAQYELGYCLLHGSGTISKDEDRGRYWLNKAAEADSDPFYAALAKIELRRRLTSDEIAKLYKGAENGDIGDAIILNKYFNEVEPDPKAAEYFLNLMEYLLGRGRDAENIPK